MNSTLQRIITRVRSVEQWMCNAELIYEPEPLREALKLLLEMEKQAMITQAELDANADALIASANNLKATVATNPPIDPTKADAALVAAKATIDALTAQFTPAPAVAPVATVA